LVWQDFFFLDLRGLEGDGDDRKQKSGLSMKDCFQGVTTI
jgi:hypothetical protein